MDDDPWSHPIYLRPSPAAPLRAAGADLEAAARLEIDALRRRGLARPADLLQCLFLHDGRRWRLSALRDGVLVAPAAASSEEDAWETGRIA